jgi:hypothetical protein
MGSNWGDDDSHKSPMFLFCACVCFLQNLVWERTCTILFGCLFNHEYIQKKGQDENMILFAAASLALTTGLGMNRNLVKISQYRH